MSSPSDPPKSCPKCGITLPVDATDGLCPNCLMNEALQPTQVTKDARPKGGAILTPEELAPLFPQYEILRILGRGGMGAVYLGRQVTLDRLVAIKILPAELEEGDLGFSERFKNEARAMAKLSHPGIVAVYDFGETANGLLYIVMEYIEGTDVQLMLTNQGRLHSAHAMAITAHVCDALAYAHARGIIHRDIKPSNIMVSNEGVVKVADFGLAKMSHAQTTGLTQSGMAMGTLHFMAPEALTLGSAVDQRADIYAVGVMLYQMLTGALPQGMFEMPSFQIPGLDPRYDRIVAKALRQDREQRYQVAGELRHDLDAILTQPVEKTLPDAEEVKALPPVEQRAKKVRARPLPRIEAGTPRPPKRNAAPWIVAVIGMAAAAAAAWLWLHPDDRLPEQVSTAAAPASPVRSPATMADGVFVTVPLHDIALHLMDSFGVPLAGRRIFNGVPFEFANPPKYFITQNQFQPQSPPSAALKVNVPGASEVFLMMCGKGGGLPELDGKEIGNVTLGFSDGSNFVAPLKMETHLRRASWLSDHTHPVKPPGDDVVQVSEAIVEPQFRGRPAKGYMDMLTIRLPPEKSRLTLTGITFNDTSIQTVKSMGPGFDVYAVTVRGNAPSAIAATKETPFVNSLGMKFTSVPVIGGPTDGKRVLFSVWETRVQDYASFASETGRAWTKPPFEQGPDHPAVNVSWDDAKAFCAWLTEREHQTGRLDASVVYRLPSDHEWSCAAGIGDREDASRLPREKTEKITDVFPWGTGWPPPPNAGNFGSEELTPALSNRQHLGVIAGYRDGYANTSPVGAYAPNPFGLYDMGGNVQQWCEDWFEEEQKLRVARGSSWNRGDRIVLLSSLRSRMVPVLRGVLNGFRCVIAPAQP